MQVNQILNEIDREIERLQKARELLAGSAGMSEARSERSTKAPSPAKKRRGRRRLSAEGRRRISEALKARWAERKKSAGKASK